MAFCGFAAVAATDARVRLIYALHGFFQGQEAERAHIIAVRSEGLEIRRIRS